MNATDSNAALAALLPAAVVIPVLVIDDVQTAVPLAQALVAGGIGVLEVTLRTPAALAAVSAIAAAVPAARVGVGSVIEPGQFALARAAGATFAVSPGATAELDAAATTSGLAWLPGIQTASEALALRARGRRWAKFFPAESAGGVGFLRALAGPIPDLRYCPTGGIDAERARDYLALANVACVGGSWLAPAALVRAGDWAAITRLAQAAARLRG